MPYKGIYIFWSLLPLSLFVLGVVSFLKVFPKRKKREYYSLFFSQAFFSAIALLIAVFLDPRLTPLFQTPPLNFIAEMVWHWLLFPSILVLMALLHARLVRHGYLRKKELEQERKIAKLH